MSSLRDGPRRRRVARSRWRALLAALLRGHRLEDRLRVEVVAVLAEREEQLGEARREVRREQALLALAAERRTSAGASTPSSASAARRTRPASRRGSSTRRTNTAARPSGAVPPSFAASRWPRGSSASTSLSGSPLSPSSRRSPLDVDEPRRIDRHDRVVASLRRPHGERHGVLVERHGRDGSAEGGPLVRLLLERGRHVAIVERALIDEQRAHAPDAEALELVGERAHVARRERGIAVAAEDELVDGVARDLAVEARDEAVPGAERAEGRGGRRELRVRRRVQRRMLAARDEHAARLDVDRDRAERAAPRLHLGRELVDGLGGVTVGLRRRRARAGWFGRGRRERRRRWRRARAHERAAAATSPAWFKAYNDSQAACLCPRAWELARVTSPREATWRHPASRSCARGAFALGRTSPAALGVAACARDRVRLRWPAEAGERGGRVRRRRVPRRLFAPRRGGDALERPAKPIRAATRRRPAGDGPSGAPQQGARGADRDRAPPRPRRRPCSAPTSCRTRRPATPR